MKPELYQFLIRHEILLSGVKYIKTLPQKRKAKRQFKKDLKVFNATNERLSLGYDKRYLWPCIMDRYEGAGNLGAYFWQDLWCARLISQNNPKDHYDIGSRIDGFIAHLASFRNNIHLIDIRPLGLEIPGVDFIQADATGLEGIEDCSVESISALCSLEHFGLGRYGDPIDPEACFKAMESIVRVLSFGGHAYISVPIGKEHLEFNAQRVFYAETIINAFNPLKCVEFSSYIGDGKMEYNCDLHKYDDEDNNFGARFGLFHFIK